MAMVETEIRGPVGLITLNNPPMNVLCSALLEELGAAVERLGGDESVKALVITGAGRAFVAGADIKEMAGMDRAQALEFAKRGQGVFDKIANLEKPVIAAVNGFALGGGTELALACDIRIASGAAKFGQPEVNLGVVPGFGGTQRLARLIGPGKAKELIFTGDIITAKKAFHIGLAQQIVLGYKKADNGELIINEKGKPIQDNGPVVEAAIKMAQTIAAKGPLAISYAKQALAQGLDLPLAEGLALEAEKFADCFATSDQKEGMAAFVEKRKAEFKGK